MKKIYILHQLQVCVTLYWLGRAMSNKVDYVGPQLCLEAFESMVSAEDVSVKNVRINSTTLVYEIL